MEWRECPLSIQVSHYILGIRMTDLNQFVLLQNANEIVQSIIGLPTLFPAGCSQPAKAVKKYVEVNAVSTDVLQHSQS